MDNKRERPRININHVLSCQCHDTTGNPFPEQRAMLINISMSGSLIETLEPLPTNLITLCNTGDDGSLCIKGKVVHTGDGGSVFGEYKTGITFTDSHTVTKQFIVSIVKPEQKQPAEDQGPGFDEQSEDTLLVSNVAFKDSMLDITVKESLKNGNETQLTDRASDTDEYRQYREVVELTDDKSTFEDTLENIEEFLADTPIGAEAGEDASGLEITLKTPAARPAAMAAEHKPGNETIPRPVIPVTTKDQLPPPKTDIRLKPVSHSFLYRFNTVGLSVSTVILITLSAVTVYVYSVNGREPGSGWFPIEIPFLLEAPPPDLKTLSVPDPKPSGTSMFLDESSIFTSVIRNAKEPLFIVRGYVSGPGGTSDHPVRITGKLLNNTNVVLSELTVYAGHRISDAQLSSMGSDAIYARLKKKPETLATENAPFIVVFANFPETIARFSVDVIPPLNKPTD